MKKIFYIAFFLITLFAVLLHQPIYAATNVENDIGPIPCFGGACPPDLPVIYSGPTKGIPADEYVGEQCVSTYEEFLVNPQRLHFWAEDVEVTNQGKADERARQFINWVISKPAIDNHAILRSVWNTTRNISYFLVVIMAAVIGLGFIISQRTNFNLKIKVWPAIWKILLALLYITFSAAIVLFLIQLSELMMKFFIESLGADKLFNIYFYTNKSSEFNYTSFFGCRDLNIRSQEAADTEMMMLRFTNITYYVMGSMLLLRKILLWFLLFVSPFLAILMPFVFIRNTGWIWIGVFFQWLFYGPLFALFLGALAKIWGRQIPFQFDFSRAGTPQGYIYPTAIRILYGGPAQKLSILNNANYIDTYVEYIITLLMLWAVTFFPWWLLRIFRDYCCDVFAAANNVLLSMYDQMRAGPIVPPPVAPIIKPQPRPTAGAVRDIPRGTDRGTIERPMVVKLESIAEIKQAKTQDIMSSLNLYAPRLTDIAKFETNKETKNAVQKNLSYLANPVKAETPTERQAYMNLRTELFSRASKDDKLAKEIISSTSTSFVDKQQRRDEILKSTPQAIPMAQVISSTTQISQEKIQSITTNLLNSIANNSSATSSIAQSTQLPQTKVQSILNTYSQNISQPMNQIINNIAQATNTSKEKISEVLKQAMNVNQQSNVVSQTAISEKISNETVQRVLKTLPNIIAQQQTQSMSQNISVIASVPQDRVQSITNNIFNNIANNNKVTNAIAESSQLSQQQVKSVLTSYTQNMNQPAGQLMSSISQQTSVSKEKVAQVLDKSNMIINQASIISETATQEKTDKQTVQKVAEAVHDSIQSTMTKDTTFIQSIAGQINVPLEKAKSITNTIFNSIVNNTNTMQYLQKETNLSTNQLKNVLTTYNQNVNEKPEVITERIHQAAGIEKERVAPVLKQVMSTLGNESVVPSTVIDDIAKKEGVKVADIKKVVDAQVPVITEPDKHVEKSIPIPSTISLEDYEEVKKMWTQQYEKGEVPTTENIANREQWVDQDTVFITNTLNKLLSSDETLKREGLDDLGYILPVFMVNNLKGDELMVYLKAKLEAAKSVKSEMIKETEKTVESQPEEIFVDVKRAAQEAAPKVLHMELEEEQTEKPTIQVNMSGSTKGSDEDFGSALRESIASLKNVQPVFTFNVSEIKNIKTDDLVRNLDMFASKLTDIARLDSNRKTRANVEKHIEYLANPTKATTPADRQNYLDIRSELTTRAGGTDKVAQRLVSPSKDLILSSVPQAATATTAISKTVNLPTEKIQTVTSTIMQTASQNTKIITALAQATQLPQTTVQTVVNAFNQNMNVPTNQITQTIAQQTNIPKEKVGQVLQNLGNIIEQSRVVDTIAEKEFIKVETVQQVIQSMNSQIESAAQSPVIDQSLSGELLNSTKLPIQTINTVAQNAFTYVVNTPSMVQYIQNQTGLTEQQIKIMVSSLSQNLEKPLNVILNQIAQQVGVTPRKVAEAFDVVCYVTHSKNTIQTIAQNTKTEPSSVERITQSLSNISKETVQNTTSISQSVANETKISEQQAQSVISSVINSAVSNDTVMQSIQNQTGINQQQIKNVLSTYTQNTSQPAHIIIDRIAQSAGIEKSKVIPLLQTTIRTINTNTTNSKEIIKDIATKQGISEKQVGDVFGAQVPVMTSPEENIEKAVPLPADVSLEDYEEVKNMWTQQYETGEVPTGEKISSREGWILQDIVLLTNILNKLLSPDEKLRREALDEVGFLLPIFMVNNLSGKELLVYLKAKLEAAKAVLKQMKKENDLKNKLKEIGTDEEELVEVKKPATIENKNEMEMSVEEPKQSEPTQVPSENSSTNVKQSSEEAEQK